jgi:hypothetical protein
MWNLTWRVGRSRFCRKENRLGRPDPLRVERVGDRHPANLGVGSGRRGPGGVDPQLRSGRLHPPIGGSRRNFLGPTGNYSRSVPMYGSCAAIVPVAVVLFEKGIPLGTALAFMMAMAALSLPEAVMLRRVMKLPLIALFFGIASLAIIATGYLLNALSQFL